MERSAALEFDLGRLGMTTAELRFDDHAVGGEGAFVDLEVSP
jgi:hypothetical protein